MSRFKLGVWNEKRCKFIEHIDKTTVLYVLRIFKCGGDERTGRALVKLIDKLAESIPRVKYIELQDDSTISMCDEDISLRNLKKVKNIFFNVW